MTLTAARSAAICVVLAVFAGCGGDPAAVLVTPGVTGTASGAPATATPGPGGSGSPTAGSPAVTIEQPTDGSTVPSGPLLVRAGVSGFGLDPSGPGPRGRLIFYIDVDFVPTEAGQPAHTGPGTFQSSAAPEVTWPAVADGKHALFVQLVNDDDTPLQPAITARAVVTVSSP